MWWILRDRRLGGYKFRRQFPIGKYSADFCCYEKRVVVEIDGIQHENAAEADLIREEFMNAAGFRVIRFWATEIGARRDEVLERIRGFLEL